MILEKIFAVCAANIFQQIRRRAVLHFQSVNAQRDAVGSADIFVVPTRVTGIYGGYADVRGELRWGDAVLESRKPDTALKHLVRDNLGEAETGLVRIKSLRRLRIIK